MLYRDGKGVAQNYGKARAYYEQAAKQGHAMARAALQIMNRQGL
ncbi:hypothetical protein [Snodgrassella sp. CFCC 13594]